MRVQFDYTIDDLVDVQMRYYKKSKIGSSTIWKNALIWSLPIGLLLFTFIRTSMLTKLIFAIVGALFVTIIYIATAQRGLRKRLLELNRKSIDLNEHKTCEVELIDQGIWTRQALTQSIYEWSNVKEIEEDNDAIVIYMQDGDYLRFANELSNRLMSKNNS